MNRRSQESALITSDIPLFWAAYDKAIATAPGGPGRDLRQRVSQAHSCLKEGSADFVGKLTAGRLLERVEALHRWGNAQEKQLWEEFQKEMHGTNTRRWLYGGSETAERPVDMGYYVGYKITDAYWKTQRDKTQALRTIFTITDPKAFLEASRYGEKFC